MKHGDFSGLAENYSKYRPGYSDMVVDLIGKTVSCSFPKVKAIKVVDVGAGTGIFSRMLAGKGLEVTAVEPNDDMRIHGIEDCKDTNISYINGSAEETGLENGCCALVTMASSFHWPDFNKAVAEFARLLRPGGYFLALWNTRAVERDPFTKDVEEYLHKLLPKLKRKSSGRSEFCDNLHSRLSGCDEFEDVVYLEGFHVEQQNQERYIGLWNSVNDIRVQAGEEQFKKFMDYIEKETNKIPYINAHYQTRAWLARRK
ncbi:class I SAM-dependent methyltransferase [Maridesulfovibrio zosterae]|uniref:class I SAM-dependent methyltransferase n=1 Tax=Maridesulfovibrio zosterae TaxID=82171 RepID=UPI0003FB53C7|nr:class I SAM-dependent methyltransferase [Maridesulfovibrio zosterae]